MINYFLFSFFIILHFIPLNGSEDYSVIDSRLTFEEAVSGMDFPENIKEKLVLTDVLYYSFDGRIHQGQLLIHKEVENDIIEVFDIILNLKFPVAKVIPISEYNWNDSLSMADNNTSAFNFRKIKGTGVLSSHSTGRAVDINPLLNPQIRKGETIPHISQYDPEKPGTFLRRSPIVQAFIDRGWQWGGNWKSTKDYQHFEKK
jgi:peptidoglycan LD-endopeptidase CwlK